MAPLQKTKSMIMQFVKVLQPTLCCNLVQECFFFSNVIKYIETKLLKLIMLLKQIPTNIKISNENNVWLHE